jgi:hypothetical protein
MIPTCFLFAVILVRASKSAAVLFLARSVIQFSCHKAFLFSLSGFYRPLRFRSLFHFCSLSAASSQSQSESYLPGLAQPPDLQGSDSSFLELPVAVRVSSQGRAKDSLFAVVNSFARLLQYALIRMLIVQYTGGQTHCFLLLMC